MRTKQSWAKQENNLGNEHYVGLLIPRPCGGAFHCNEGEVCREYWEVGKVIISLFDLVYRNLSYQNYLF